AAAQVGRSRVVVVMEGGAARDRAGASHRGCGGERRGAVVGATRVGEDDRRVGLVDGDGDRRAVAGRVVGVAGVVSRRVVDAGVGRGRRRGGVNGAVDADVADG